jgi:hypothetical protein
LKLALKKRAVLSWPKELLEREASISVLPTLLKTQDKFISVLNLCDSCPEAWKKCVDISQDMKGNVFLKHLMVLSDLGGEALNKLPPIERYFKDGQMNYVWREKRYSYQFKSILGNVRLTNSALRVDGKRLLKGYPLDSKMEDVIMILLHGAASIGDSLPQDVKDKCTIGSLIGQSEQLNKFVRQNYIRVSRQISGATSNKLGQLAQDYVIENLRQKLPGWQFKRNGRIPGISHTEGKTETTFDIVGESPEGKYFALEVSFQYTTNSVIERKAGQAKARKDLLNDAGHKICYVIDGEGNINVRESAARTLFQFSDFTVALSADEIREPGEFLLENA